MISQIKSTGMFRVRYHYGHEKRYRALKKIKEPNQKVLDEINKLEQVWGLPNPITTRRSQNCVHRWQAEQIEDLFKVAHDYDIKGKAVPKNLLEIDIAPERSEYIDEMGYFMASICGFREELLDNIEYDLFVAQSDANESWILEMGVSYADIKMYAEKHCQTDNRFKLKDKVVIFTGAVTGFTGDEDYLKSLRKLALEIKADAIITSGAWIKTIFLHKTASDPVVLPALKKLAKDVRILAIRSNRDKPDHLHKLKEYGIEFINGIEDNKHVFTGLSTGSSSAKNQLDKFDDAFHGKNVYFFSTFVGIKSQGIKGGGLRYLVGSGSSGYNTPRARVWANAYDNQLLNSGIRDSIGGHVLRFDSKGTVFPTTFRFHNKMKAILFGSRAFFGSKIVKGGQHVIVSDFHACSHHKYAFTALLEFLDKHKDDIITFVLNGDFFDNMVLCHHNKGKIKTQIEMAKRDMDFLKEVAYAKECLKIMVSRLASGTKLIFKLGNHEVNSFSKFLERDINHFLESMLDIDRLLGLSEMGFDIIPAKEAYEVGEVTIHHGHEMQRVQAAKIFGKNSTRGHSHGLLIDSMGMTLSGMEDRDKAHYLYHPYVNWTVGFASITEVDSYSVLPQPILVTDRQYADFEGVRKIDKTFEVPLPKTLSVEYEIDWTGREEL